MTSSNLICYPYLLLYYYFTIKVTGILFLRLSFSFFGWLNVISLLSIVIFWVDFVPQSFSLAVFSRPCPSLLQVCLGSTWTNKSSTVPKLLVLICHCFFLNRPVSAVKAMLGPSWFASLYTSNSFSKSIFIIFKTPPLCQLSTSFSLEKTVSSWENVTYFVHQVLPSGKRTA